jgi:hypothetical protein
MWNSMIRRSIATLVFVTAAAYSASPAQGDPSLSDPFDGEWSVTATPDRDAALDGQGAFDEAILFHSGQFSAAVFAMFGFTPAEYVVSFDTGHAVFKANLNSSDRGTLAWTGEETQTGMSGTLVWTRADGTNSVYELVGERQQ